MRISFFSFFSGTGGRGILITAPALGADNILIDRPGEDIINPASFQPPGVR